MEGSPIPLPLHPLLILRPHGLFAWQRRAPGIDGCHRDGLELEERERGGVVGHADEGERRVGDVEDVFVEVVHLGAVGDEHGRGRGGGGKGVVMERAQKRVGAVVAGAEDDAVNVAQGNSVFESYGAGNGLRLSKIAR